MGLGKTFLHEGPQSSFRLRPNASARPEASDNLGVLDGQLTKVALAHAGLRQEGVNLGQKGGGGIVCHAVKVSSKEDKSSVRDRGRADFSSIADNQGMIDTGWKARLVTAIESSGASLRSVSLAAGKGPGYIHSLLAEGKDPSVSNLLMVCEAAGISGAHVLFGLDVDPATEELIRLMQSQPGKRDAILRLLQSDDPASAA